MIAAHIVLSVMSGLLVAGYAWIIHGASIWLILLAYCGAGSAACIASAALAILVAAACPGARGRSAEPST